MSKCRSSATARASCTWASAIARFSGVIRSCVEEAPRLALSDALRRGICDAAVRFCKALDYRSLGTVEFLYDRQREAFYFLEMNARIQVEHPVTEAIIGLDLVAEQIHIGQGGKLRFAQADVSRAAMPSSAASMRRRRRSISGRARAASRWLGFRAGNEIRVDTYLTSGAQRAAVL